MRRFAFIITVLGILILLIILINSKPLPLSSPESLKDLQNNQKVSLSGLVIRENHYQNHNTLTLDNDLKLECKNCPVFLNKNISAIAIIDTYQKTRIKALKISLK